MPVAAHTRQGCRIAMAWSDRLAADLGSPVRPMLAHILAWASTPRPISTIEILDSVDPLSVSPTGSAGTPEAGEPGAHQSIMMGSA